MDDCIPKGYMTLMRLCRNLSTLQNRSWRGKKRAAASQNGRKRQDGTGLAIQSGTGQRRELGLGSRKLLLQVVDMGFTPGRQSPGSSEWLHTGEVDRRVLHHGADIEGCLQGEGWQILTPSKKETGRSR
jgi:hypothetical protein